MENYLGNEKEASRGDCPLGGSTQTIAAFGVRFWIEFSLGARCPRRSCTYGSICISRIRGPADPDSSRPTNIYLSERDACIPRLPFLPPFCFYL